MTETEHLILLLIAANSFLIIGKLALRETPFLAILHFFAAFGFLVAVFVGVFT